jgi:TRAP-type C4-dicarboxylate transport system substrate-binding protein
MKKRISIVVFVVIITFVVAACSNSGGGNSGNTSSGSSGDASGNSVSADDKSDWIELDLMFATYLPETGGATKELQYIIDALEKSLPGLVNFQTYYAGTLLAQDTMFDGVKAGTADIGYVDFAASGDFPLCKIWNYPNVGVESQVGATAAFSEWARKTDAEEFKDVIFLNGFALGPSTFLTSKEVKSVDDLKGMQLYATGDMASTMDAFGVKPITMNTGEVYEAVRNGMIDGVYASFGSMARQSVTEIDKYAMMVPMGTAVYGYVMNKDTFNRMPASQQQAFLDAWDEGFWEGQIRNWERMRTMDDEVILPEAGKMHWTLIAPGTPEYKAFSDKTSGLLDEYLATLDAKGIDGESAYEEIKMYLDKWGSAWWDFERHAAPYVAAADGTLEDFEANYKIPDNMPDYK